MGNAPSFPLEPGTVSDPTVDQTPSQSNSATVVFFRILEEPELVANHVKSIINIPDSVMKLSERNCKYMRKTVKVGCPFDSANEPAPGNKNEKNDGKAPPWFPGNYGSGGGGGGGGGNIRPDEVADTFRLELIGGLHVQKEYLQRSIILPLIHREVFQEWGMRAPKGILLHGPPGTGKTFMAKALVNELKKEVGTHVNFFYRKGGDVFSMWFGESQRKLQELFETAKAMAPSIIFFDELDGLCPSRDRSQNHGTEAYASVVTCFLGQMDCLESGQVFVIAATNRLDAIDAAVLRPGRFDKHLAFNFPDEDARRNILKIHVSKWSREDQPGEELIGRLAQRTTGFSGADIEKLCNDAVYTAIQENGGTITPNMKVTERHWHYTLSSMQLTGVNNFGSYLCMPTKPTLIISKLIQPVVEEVIKKITPMLSQVSINLDHSVFHWTRKSFLVCINPTQSKSFLNNQILPGILTDSLFNKMSLFELSTAIVTKKVISGAKPTIPAVISDVINQARDYQTTENCAVVIVPNINELFDYARMNNIAPKIVLRALLKIHGPNMFLLATSSKPLEEITDVCIADLFSSHHIHANNPREGHLNNFFQFVLEEKKQANPSKREMLDRVAEEAAKSANNRNYEQILNLASELAGADGQEEQYNDIINRYETSELPDFRYC